VVIVIHWVCPKWSFVGSRISIALSATAVMSLAEDAAPLFLPVTSQALGGPSIIVSKRQLGASHGRSFNREGDQS
jgi:hypothetical protein